MSLRYRETKGYKYIVAERYNVALPELGAAILVHDWFRISEGVLTVEPGYKWDGASGPTIDTPSTIAPSLVHDVLYQCIRAGLLSSDMRAIADMIFYRLMRGTRGNTAWREIRAAYFFLAVRIFGGSATKPRAVEAQDKVYVVT
jgi:hypothetical protein